MGHLQEQNKLPRPRHPTGQHCRTAHFSTLAYAIRGSPLSESAFGGG